jgi:hypothetical protein
MGITQGVRAACGHPGHESFLGWEGADARGNGEKLHRHQRFPVSFFVTMIFKDIFYKRNLIIRKKVLIN